MCRSNEGVSRAIRGGVIVLIVAGCAFQPGAGGPSNAGSLASGGKGIPGAGAGSGWLNVRVRWPDRSLPGFQAQAIPGRTRAIRLTTLDAGRQIADLRTLVREGAPGGESTASLKLLAGTGYGLTAEAFQEADPGDDATPIAAGSAANLTIRASKILAVPVTLTSVNAPAITALSVTAGPYDTPLTVDGKNFGATPGLPWVVTIGGVPAPSERADDSRIVARVPVGAVSGQVVVRVDGIPSTTVVGFTVTQGIDATIGERDAPPLDSGLELGLAERDPGGLDIRLETDQEAP